MKVCCIVPIKHKSERVPGKNFRLFNGIPLFEVILKKLIRCSLIHTIVVDTNSPIVLSILEEKYKNSNIQIYHRPEHLWSGDTPTNVLLENVITELNLEYDFFLQTHVTNPLLSVQTIENCIHSYLEQKEKGFDSLMTVKVLHTRLYTKSKTNIVSALNHNPNELIPTQDLEPLYEENSCVYIFTKKTLFDRHHRVGYNPFLYSMSDVESVDIDYESDFVIAEVLHKQLEWKNDKVVLITGCFGGIGKELCKKFKEIGWVVVGTCNYSEYNKHVDFFIEQDLTKKDAATNIVKQIREKYNQLDCIVHNAAIQICKPIHEYKQEDWTNTYQCNVFIVQQLVQDGIDLLKKSKGTIVSIGSVHSICSSENIGCYASSKAALVGLTRNLALDLGKYGIRVNSISPGAVDTPMLRDGLLRDSTEKNVDTLLENISQKHILGKVGQPQEIANIIEFVANNENGHFINGTNLVIDGGVCSKLSTE